MLLLKGHEVLLLAITSALRQDIFWTLSEYYASRILVFLVDGNQSRTQRKIRFDKSDEGRQKLENLVADNQTFTQNNE